MLTTAVACYAYVCGAHLMPRYSCCYYEDLLSALSEHSTSPKKNNGRKDLKNIY